MLAYYLPKLISITIFRPQSIPPMTWISAADRKTREDVKSMVFTAFEMARKSPIRRRDQAIREATFHVPHEVVRFNSVAAPHFVLEDMGPMPPLPKDWEAEIPTKLKHPWNIEREARAFLYFPHKSARATTAFVAINAELPLPPDRKQGNAMHNIHRVSEDLNSLMAFGTNSWHLRYRIWADRQPDIIDRIKPGPLPVIFCFRGKVTSCLFDPKTRKGFGGVVPVLPILVLDEYST